jgi:hypothetical protein
MVVDAGCAAGLAVERLACGIESTEADFTVQCSIMRASNLL